ncbi:hypothetical protein FBU59_007042, partial [Linderina macrospora]
AEELPAEFDSERIADNAVERTSSVESDFAQTSTIPIKNASTSSKPSKGTRSRSHSRHSGKFHALSGYPISHHTSTMPTMSGSSSSEATIAELQQRLESMAREKASLETAMEQEQERMFNQGRRLSGSISPGPFVTSAGGVPGAVSPRWAHSRSSSVSSFGNASVASVGITETLKADVNSLRLRLADCERELVSCYSQSQIYKKELVALRQRLGMTVDDLYLDDPVPAALKNTYVEGSARPRRSQS